ncbi:ATP-binding protein [Sphaerisporangium album]|uniref:ATP-binding protein n=1 Tax=Sphaerisporangium album TaxID=509200 RepID=UPI0015F0630D|nr:ATP-binding protein [Sphaerisporangium album]
MKRASAQSRVLGTTGLAGVRESVSHARTEVRRWLGESHPAVDDAVLATSELVTNAIIHSGCGADGYIGLTVIEQDGAIRIEVNDPGSTVSAPEVRKDPDAESGRGLLIVRELSHDWGSCDDGPGLGRTVWCAIRFTPSSASGSLSP